MDFSEEQREDRAFVNAMAAAARDAGFKGPRADLAQWIANELESLRSTRKALFDAQTAVEDLNAKIREVYEAAKASNVTSIAAAQKIRELRAERDAAIASLSALERDVAPLREALDTTNRRNAELEAREAERVAHGEHK